MITVAKTQRTIKQEELPKLVLVHLTPLWQRLLHIKKENVQILEAKPAYYPFWFIKAEAYADRSPFSPKLRRHVLYIDAMTGDRGLTNQFPKIEQKSKTKIDVLSPRFNKEKVDNLINELVEDFILRPYLLKRPTVKIVGKELIYLHYYLVNVKTKSDVRYSLSVNSLSGEIRKNLNLT
jgi:hypothetical protein